MKDGRASEVLGVWQLGEVIGSGGIGDVYRAHRIDGVVDQVVAIKVLRTVCPDGSLEDVETGERLEHPNITRHLATGVTRDGHRYVVMEFVDGCPITEYADQKGLSIHDRLDLFLQACAAIEYAHHHIVLHLDLKPANILVNQDGTVKVIDFGISHQAQGGKNRTHEAPYSLPYASPEQIDCSEESGFSADVYGLGTVLYELLSGHEPFDPLLAAGEIERQIREDVPRPPSAAVRQSRLQRTDQGINIRLEPEVIARMRGGCRLSEAHKLIAGDLDGVCLFALRKEPHRRYRSVDDMKNDIERVLRGRKPVIARSGDPLYSALKSARRRPLEWMAGIAAVTALLSTYSFLRFFSDNRKFLVEERGQLELVAESGLRELRGDLLPMFALDPGHRGSAEATDTVIRTAAPSGTRTTATENILEYLNLGKHPTTETIPSR